MSTQSFKYPSELASEDPMYQDVASFLEMHEIEGKLKNDIKLAVSEAFTNAMLHGNKLDSSKNVEINITINEQFITADIIDEGSGDPQSLLALKDPDLWQDRGRGVILMEKIADRVSFSKDHLSGGLLCTLLFDRGRYEKVYKAEAAGSRTGG